LERSPDRLASGGIPEAQGFVVRAGDEAPAVGAEGNGSHPACMPLKNLRIHVFNEVCKDTINVEA